MEEESDTNETDAPEEQETEDFSEVLKLLNQLKENREQDRQREEEDRIKERIKEKEEIRKEKEEIIAVLKNIV